MSKDNTSCQSKIGTRICMDCGKEFTPTLEGRKPVGCWYWGKLNPCMKYQYFLGGFPWDNKVTWWEKILMKLIPDYYPDTYEPTVKPITARWALHLREWWVLLTDPVYRDLANSEMWTCHECVIEYDISHTSITGDDKE